jgi:hypothetical protein
MATAAATVAKALRDFEDLLEKKDILKLIDYVRLLEAQKEIHVALPATMTLRWTGKWESTTANER